MKYLSVFCLLLWVVPDLGKQYYPDIFGVSYIQWPAFVLLSILLPYGFSKGLCNISTQYYSFTFLFIFLLNILVMGISLNGLDSVNSILSNQQQSVPENASVEAIENDRVEVRRFMAQAIYTEFGQPIMYNNELNKLILYSPTDEDIANFRTRFTTSVETKNLIEHTEYKIKEIMYLFIIACGGFFIVFLATFLFEQRKANKQIN